MGLLLGLNACSSVAMLSMMAIHPTTIALKKDKNLNLRYEGYAFNAIINDVPVIELSDTTNYVSLKNYYNKMSIHWRTMKVISGAVKIEIKRKYIQEYNIGEIDHNDFTLTGIQLPWKKEVLKKIEQNPVAHYGNMIMIGGKVINNPKAIQAFPRVEIKQGEVLADGNYIIVIQVQGKKGWDRKEIYVEVRANAMQTKFL